MLPEKWFLFGDHTNLQLCGLEVQREDGGQGGYSQLRTHSGGGKVNSNKKTDQIIKYHYLFVFFKLNMWLVKNTYFILIVVFLLWTRFNSKMLCRIIPTTLYPKQQPPPTLLVEVLLLCLSALTTVKALSLTKDHLTLSLLFFYSN